MVYCQKVQLQDDVTNNSNNALRNKHWRTCGFTYENENFV